MARALGLDIGSRTIKVVELSGSAKSFKVQRVVIRDIPPPEAPREEGAVAPEPEQVVSGILKEIFDSLKLPRTEVCAAFAAGDTIFREIMVPFTDDDQIRKVVRFEAENHLHSYSIDDVIVNWVKTGESHDGSRLTIFAAPKADLSRTVAMLHGAGIDPASVDLDVTAVYTAYEACGVFRDHPNVVLIDVGARSTALILVANGRPLTLRSFRLGTDYVSARAVRELAMAPEEARRRATLPSGPRSDDLFVSASALRPVGADTEKSLSQLEGEALAEQREEFVKKLHRESIRSLASLQADAAPDRILLSGGGSLLPGLAEALAARFGLPAERIDLATRIDWKDRGLDPALTQAMAPAAVGCALRLLGHDPLGVELLQDEFAPTNRFDVLKNALATGVTLLFLLLFGLAIVAMQRRDAEQRRFNYAVQRAMSLHRTAEGAYLEKVESKTPDAAKAEVEAALRSAPTDHRLAGWIKSKLLNRYNWLQNNLGLRRDIPQVPSALEVWLEVVRALNQRPREEYGPHLRVLKLDVKELTASVRIEVDEQAVFDKIRQQLESSAYFKERSRESRVIEQGATQFIDGHWQQDFNFRFKEEE